MDETEIERLLAATALGDRLAFRRLFALTGPRLMALALRVLQDRAEAEAATADAYVKIWRYAERHPASGARPLTFMLAIARNIAVERLRAKRDGEVALATAEAVAAAAERTDRRRTGEDGARLQEALAAMGGDDARLVRAAYFGGVTQGALGIRQGVASARTRVDRIAAALAGGLLP